MHYNKFKKLDMDLPMQPTTDQRPWLASGLLFAILILVMAAFAYFDNKKKETSYEHQKVNTSNKNNNTSK